MATHTDQDHIHNHLVINSVNWETGYKFQQSRKDLTAIKEFSNQLCKQAGLSTIEIGKENPAKARSMAEIQIEQRGGVTWRGILKADLDAEIPRAISFPTLLTQMQAKGYAVKQGAHITFRPPGGTKFIRLRSLGPGYSKEEIIQRIQARHTLPKEQRQFPKPPTITRTLRRCPNYRKRKKYTGILALYWRYLYMLGKVRKNTTRPYISKAIKKDLIKFRRYQQQFFFLHAHKVVSMERLGQVEQDTRQEMGRLTQRRKVLHREKKRAVDLQPCLDEIAAINERLKGLRRDLRTVEGVKESSREIRERQAQIIHIRQEQAQRAAQRKRDAGNRIR